MKIQKHKLNSGFTIIEVMIVLAIAGLILAIIFLAVPALERAARNNSRKNDASHLGGLIDQYEANNSGSLPTAISTANQPATPTAGTLYTGTEVFAIETVPTAPAAVPATTLPTTIDQLYFYTPAVCSGNTPTNNGGTVSTHSAVLYFMVEASGGNQGQCIPI